MHLRKNVDESILYIQGLRMQSLELGEKVSLLSIERLMQLPIVEINADHLSCEALRYIASTTNKSLKKLIVHYHKVNEATYAELQKIQNIC